MAFDEIYDDIYNNHNCEISLDLNTIKDELPGSVIL